MTLTRGILGEKLGMTQIFDGARAIPVTVIKAGPNTVAQIKTQATDGYDAVQLVFQPQKPQKVNKPMKGHFEKYDAAPGRQVVELRTDDASSYESGQEVTVDRFEVGERVDVIGVSKGKGFAGPMKRHGFHGMGASHGAEKVHRSPGSIGGASTPSRVFRGMKMAGQMGSERTTILNLEVVTVDPERNLLLVKGAVPGATGSLIMVRNAIKAPLSKGGAA